VRLSTLALFCRLPPDYPAGFQIGFVSYFRISKVSQAFLQTDRQRDHAQTRYIQLIFAAIYQQETGPARLVTLIIKAGESP
jgi:hypothetical protein